MTNIWLVGYLWYALACIEVYPPIILFYLVLSGFQTALNFNIKTMDQANLRTKEHLKETSTIGFHFKMNEKKTIKNSLCHA